MVGGTLFMKKVGGINGKCNYIIIISILIAFFVVLSIGVKYNLLIHQADIAWYLDPKLSWDIVFDTKYLYSSDFEDIDVIQVYKNKQKGFDMFNLSEIYKMERVYETTDKKIINKIINYAKQSKEEIECTRIEDGDSFHIILYDSTLSRVGYLLFTTYKSSDCKYGRITPLHESGSFIFNKVLFDYFKDEILIIRSK